MTWNDGIFITSIRVYPKPRLPGGRTGTSSAVVFEQRFPRGLRGTTLNPQDPWTMRDDVSAAFPTLVPARPVSFLALAGHMMGESYAYGVSGKTAVPGGIHGTGPVAYFENARGGDAGTGLSAMRAAIVSPFQSAIAMNAAPRRHGEINATAYGPLGSFTEIPPHFTVRCILAAHEVGPSSGGGVRLPAFASAMTAWGDTLLREHGRERHAAWAADETLQRLGYSTDNGAFYYYITEPEKNYQATMADVAHYAKSVGLPYSYALLDSWWYYKGFKDGVIEWVARPDIFPGGMQAAHNETEWYIQAHNRWWAQDVVYAKQNNLGYDYDFLIEACKSSGCEGHFQGTALPLEERFWDDLIRNSTRWGLRVYEQDWLYTHFDKIVALNTNATLGMTWLRQMASACARHGVVIQYCMSDPRHILQATELPAVTNARASDDYHPGNDQWRQLGTTSLFGWAVGLGASKDNYWSTEVQSGSRYGDDAKEPYNVLQSAVISLSKGPVAPSDKIGASNVSLIMRCCAADGLLLQADTPAFAVDSQHIGLAASAAAKAAGVDSKGAWTGEVWATVSTVSGAGDDSPPLWATVGTVFAVLTEETVALDPREVFGYGDDVATSAFAVASARHPTSSGLAEVVRAGQPIQVPATPTKADVEVLTVAPRLPNGWAFLGETADVESLKWVAASPQRFSDLAWQSEGGEFAVAVTVRGSVKETVAAVFVAPNGHKAAVRCTIGVSQSARIVVGGAVGTTGACVAA
eukprot:TRINITY_DN20876_c0_g1_i1.p1 TRINITY_DN20876_c0_g1~~TRINITY_DN20876_c0_g1_i1.p1  ORF type:complete len:853 (+),score=147.81 TRINITY_DN20876_c0_g1_i1:312-2561(+)